MHGPSRDRKFFRQFTVHQLGEQEDRLLAVVASLTGDAAERDRALARAGVYRDYAAIIDAYSRRSGDGVEGAEAFRRTVFFVWCSAAYPACLTGVAELGEVFEDDVMSWLDDECAAEMLDPQLQWMLGYYYAQYPTVFTRFGNATNLHRVLDDASWDDWRRAEPSPRDFAERGLMGYFWREILRSV